MLSTIFGQYDYNYTYTTTNVDTGGFFLFSGVFLVVWLVYIALVLVALWKLFEKLGYPGWKGIVPIYNYWLLCQKVGRPGWWALSFLFGIIPVVGWIVPTVLGIIVMLDLGRAFKKSTAFSVVALILFSVVGLLMLAFGKDKFHKADPVSLGGIDPKFVRYDDGSASADSKKES